MQTHLTGRTDHNRLPSALGGKPAFENPVSIIRPNLPPWSSIAKRLEEIYGSRMLTNHDTVREFERAAARYLGVDHVVGLSSCTSGLILALRALEITGEVIVPSFTFSATGHSIYWAGARPVFVDCDRNDWNICIDSVRGAVTDETEAIVAVHIFGNPAPVHALEELADELGIPLIFDAAHALGAAVGDKHVGGFGAAEIFSLSPTKLLTGCEGGLLATNDRELANKIAKLRNYGMAGDYDCYAPGLNARMGEFNAAVAIEGLSLVDPEIIKRHSLADIYRDRLSEVPGITFQLIPDGNHHTYKDLTIKIDSDTFGMDRDRVHSLLLDENIHTKKYFFPPLHQQSAYRGLPWRATNLSVTERLSRNVLTLPLYSELGSEGVELIASAIASLHQHADTLTGSIIRNPDRKET